MNSRPDERLPYLELARQGARVARSVQAEQLPRLEQMAPPTGTLAVELAFSLDGDGRPWVSGTARATVTATCHGCLEAFEHPMLARFELCIVSDQRLASRLAGEMDVVVAAGSSISIAEVVEDELILGLPERLCSEEPCANRPPLHYPADEQGDPHTARQDNPFHVLSELKRG